MAVKYSDATGTKYFGGKIFGRNGGEIVGRDGGEIVGRDGGEIVRCDGGEIVRRDGGKNSRRDTMVVTAVAWQKQKFDSDGGSYLLAQ
jgi:hypothetical protein